MANCVVTVFHQFSQKDLLQQKNKKLKSFIDFSQRVMGNANITFKVHY